MLSLAWTLEDATPGLVSDGATSDPSGKQHGKDLLFVDGDVQLDAAGDYVTIADEAALRQAILIRLLVSPGEYKLRPTFGVGVAGFVKKSASKSVRDELRRRIVDQLSLERRIEKIVEVAVERTVQSGVQIVIVRIVARAFGRQVTFKPFNFKDPA